MEKKSRIRVYFVFNETDLDKEARLSKTREFLQDKAIGPIQEAQRQLKSGAEEVCFDVVVLSVWLTRHHTFDSVLNKTHYPDGTGGCGAGSVEVVQQFS